MPMRSWLCSKQKVHMTFIVILSALLKDLIIANVLTLMSVRKQVIGVQQVKNASTQLAATTATT